MTAEQFTYWLQGFLEIQDPKALDAKQTQIIKDHLNLVFNKVTPDRTVVKKTSNQTLNLEDLDRRFIVDNDLNGLDTPLCDTPTLCRPLKSNGTFIC